MIDVIGYEVHWARANRADEMSAMRHGAQRHVLHSDAEAEAATLSHAPDMVPIVVAVRGVIGDPRGGEWARQSRGEQ